MIGLSAPLTGCASFSTFGLARTLRVAPCFRIFPEVAIGVPAVASTVDVGSSAFNALIFQGGVGFLFGSSNQYDPPAPPPAATATR